MNGVRYELPTDLESLAACLARADRSTHLLGGGTDLLPRFQGRIPPGTTLIDVTSVAGLDALEVTGDTLTLGANVTYARLAADPFIQARIPCLAAMAAGIGSAQIRNTARLAGNLANASPGGDAIGTLLALGAEVQVLGPQGTRRSLTVDELVLGVGRTSLAGNEAILGCRIPVPRSARSGFGKIGLAPRSQVVIANVSLTCLFDYREAEGRIERACLVLGSAGPKAFRACSAEALCAGQAPSAALAGAVAASLRRSVQDSIGAHPLFQHKLNDVQGLAQDVFRSIFADLL